MYKMYFHLGGRLFNARPLSGSSTLKTTTPTTAVYYDSIREVHTYCNGTSTATHSILQLVVMGVANCHGYKLLQLLHRTEPSVVVAPIEEDSSFLKLLTNVRKLQNNLKSQDISLAWVNFSHIKEVIRSSYKPNIVIYTHVYTIINNYMESLRTDFTQKISATLQNFVSLLEVVRTACPRITVVLPLIELSSLIQRAWLKQFEVTLVTYQTLYDLNVALLHINARSGTDYKPEGGSDEDCKSIEHHILQLASTNTNQLLNFVPCDERDASEWCSDYDHIMSTPLSNDVIFSSYFVTKNDPQRSYHIIPNRFHYIKSWFIGAMKNHLNIIIFYDRLDASWISRAEAKYPRAKFIHGDLKGRSLNDARYYLMQNYLVNNPEIERSFITDARDVQLWSNPFHLMDKLGNDMLYIGQDTPFYISADDQPWINKVLRWCYGQKIFDTERDAVHNLWTLYSAGIVGGNRDTMLAVLARVHEWLDKANRGVNCNMASVNIAAHKYFFEDVFVGYPLQSGYKIEIAGPFGLAIKHK